MHRRFLMKFFFMVLTSTVCSAPIMAQQRSLRSDDSTLIIEGQVRNVTRDEQHNYFIHVYANRKYYLCRISPLRTKVVLGRVIRNEEDKWLVDRHVKVVLGKVVLQGREVPNYNGTGTTLPARYEGTIKQLTVLNGKQSADLEPAEGVEKLSTNEWRVIIKKQNKWFDTGVPIRSDQTLHIVPLNYEDGTKKRFYLRLENLNATSLPTDSGTKGWGIHTFYVASQHFEKYKFRLNEQAWATVRSIWTDRIRLKMHEDDPSDFLILNLNIEDVENDQPIVGAMPASEEPLERGILNNNAISFPKPDYPEEAKKLGLTGTVVINVVVDETGNVISSIIMQEATRPEDQILWKAAIKAARQAKFQPYKVNGTSVRVKGQLVYVF